MTLTDLADWHREQAWDLKLKKVTPDSTPMHSGFKSYGDGFSLKSVFETADLISFHQQAEKLLRGVREIKELEL